MIEKRAHFSEPRDVGCKSQKTTTTTIFEWPKCDQNLSLLKFSFLHRNVSTRVQNHRFVPCKIYHKQQWPTAPLITTTTTSETMNQTTMNMHRSVFNAYSTECIFIKLTMNAYEFFASDRSIAVSHLPANPNHAPTHTHQNLI